MSDEQGAPTPPQPSLLHRVAGVAGILLYLAVGWIYLASGLIVPFPWLLVLWAIWGGGWVVLVKVFRATPIRTVLVPLAAAAIWVLLVQLGGSLLGWTA